MISGGIKFFDRSKCLFEDGTSITASSGDAAADRCLDRNPLSVWRSVGSNDMTQETLEVVLTEAQAINRLFLIDHNFKAFNVQWYDGVTYQPFTNVVGLGGALSGIVETVYARDTAYYEFDSVTTTRLRVQIDTTQVVDAQKYLSQIIATTELGTLTGHPQIKAPQLSRNLRTEKMLSGRSLTFKSDETFSVGLDFKSYPASLSADIDLIFSMADREDTFLIWMCGGRFGSQYFKKQMRGYRLRDVVAVQLVDVLKPVYSDNVFQNTVNFAAAFQESVG